MSSGFARHFLNFSGKRTCLVEFPLAIASLVLRTGAPRDFRVEHDGRPNFLYAAPDMIACAAFSEESQRGALNFDPSAASDTRSATTLHEKMRCHPACPGLPWDRSEAKWRDLLFSPSAATPKETLHSP